MSLVTGDYDINSTLEELKQNIQRQGQERVRQRFDERIANAGNNGLGKQSKSISIPAKMTSIENIDSLIKQLMVIKTELDLYEDVEILFSLDVEGGQ